MQVGWSRLYTLNCTSRSASLQWRLRCRRKLGCTLRINTHQGLEEARLGERKCPAEIHSQKKTSTDPLGSLGAGMPLQSHPKLIKGNLRIHCWRFSHCIVSDSRDPMDWSPQGLLCKGIYSTEWLAPECKLSKEDTPEGLGALQQRPCPGSLQLREGSVQFSSVQFSHSVVSNSLWLHVLQHTRPPCPTWTPGAYANSCPLSRWCHPTISSSVIPFSSCL